MSLTDEPEFQSALTEAEALAARPRRKRPTRFLARALLVHLGEALLAGEGEGAPAGDADVQSALRRVRALFDGDPVGWREATHEELTLATTEHVRSCEPRYLSLPNYDLPYTVAARHRLEARLRAASELECPVDETLLEQIERADAVLQPYLDR